MMKKLFGTDGIRGRALEAPLDETTVSRLGAALAGQLQPRRSSPHVLLAGDTRASTETLAAWFGGAFQASGGTITWGGVLPTPAVSILLSTGDYDAGVVISASHNPAHDNGIKVLGAGGEKIGDDEEAALEAAIGSVHVKPGPALPSCDASLAEAYVRSLCATHSNRQSLAGLEVVVDAAHGAASGIARRVFEELGARVVTMASTPDGTNINDGCGATAPQALAKRVVSEGAHGGLALDGDADRSILVDEKGVVLDGDDTLLAWARDLRHHDRLPGGRVVATVMSNYGLERALAQHDMSMIRCPVGDRSVWLTMCEREAALGGEQSGHVICSHFSVSGDGLLTGTQVLAIAARAGTPVSRLSDLDRLPQVLINVPVQRKLPFEELATVSAELAGTEQRLDGHGRVLLRYSGTEALARVMVEGDDAAEIEALAAHLAQTISRELG